MSGQQKALWLKEAKAEFAVGPKPIDKPGPGELLVKIEATALNPVSTVVLACVRTSRQQLYRPTGRRRSSRFQSSTRPFWAWTLPVLLRRSARASPDGRRVIACESIAAHWVCGVHSRRRGSLHEGDFPAGSKLATFQQYTTIPANLAAKVCSIFSFIRQQSLTLCLRSDPEQCVYRGGSVNSACYLYCCYRAVQRRGRRSRSDRALDHRGQG
jgi:hypothetical protein